MGRGRRIVMPPAVLAKERGPQGYELAAAAIASHCDMSPI